MAAFDFLPDIPMDKTHSLDQMTGRFQSIKEGLPELVKNAKDQYARLGVGGNDDRQIVVIASSRKLSLGVLDFAGARSEDFSGWQTWSSRTASQSEASPDIEGGHGNGGKAFMVRGCVKLAYMESCAAGLRTKMGFDNYNSKVKYIPGYAMADHKKVLDLRETQPRQRLDEALAEFGLKFENLPKPCQSAFARRKAFTLVKLDGVRDWENRRKSTVLKLIGDIPSLLANHAQAALTIETCAVWVMGDRDLLTKNPLAPNHPEPMKGFENIPPISVPDELQDPSTGEMVSTGAGGADAKVLQLRTSDKQLRLSEDRKALNTIRVRNARNVVANWGVAGLVPRAESGFVFGTLRVPDLTGEHLADSHRSELADTALSRALREWTVAQIDELSDQIQKAHARETKAEDQERATNTLAQMRELMRQYLESEDAETEPEKADDNGKGPEGRKKTHKGKTGPHGQRIHEILFEPGRDRVAMAVGTTVPIVVRCYELDAEGKKHPVVGAPLTLGAAIEGVFRLNPDLTITALAPGATDIWLQDPATGVESSHLNGEVLVASGVDIIRPAEPLLQGQRHKLPITFATSAGPRDDLLVDGTIDEAELGRLSRTGFFTAGLAAGIATVRVRFGPGRGDAGVATIEIGTERVPPAGRGGKGSDIPLILLCGETPPGMEEYPEGQRTHPGGDHFPTIIEEPQFPQVVWVNQHSKESIRVRAGRGGSSGMGRVAAKTFLQFVALKCFDILKRLKVRQELKGSVTTETDFTQKLAQAEMDCAGFIDGAYQIAEGLTKGETLSE